MADGGALNSAVQLRPIDASDFVKLPGAGPEPGAAPMLQWVRVADLVVDDGYQRPVVGAGRTNVRRIATEFRWSKFAPVICAPVAGGKFAVIDGQHRATAAALLGIESVPAQVIIADKVEQAAAFKSINGQVTRMHNLALHHAALAAGDASARELASACDAAGVKILRYPRIAEMMEPGETLALGSISEGLRKFGRETVVAGLTCVTRTSNNRSGVLSSSVMRALFSVLGGNARWRDAGPRLLSAFEGIDLELELEEAKVTRRPKTTALWEVLAQRLKDQLEVSLPPPGRGLGSMAAQEAPAETTGALPVPPPRQAAPGRVLTAVAARREVRGVLQTDGATPVAIARALKIGEAAVREALRELAEAGEASAGAMPSDGWQGQVWSLARKVGP